MAKDYLYNSKESQDELELACLPAGQGLWGKDVCRGHHLFQDLQIVHYAKQGIALLDEILEGANKTFIKGILSYPCCI